jgi:alanine racemase
VDVFYRPTRVEISLDALRYNMEQFRRVLPPDMKMMAVVKANGYGHGAIEIAEEAVRAGAAYVGVAFLDEAMELRKAGIRAPILVLGYTPPEGIPLARENNVTLNVYDREMLEALRDSEAGKPIKIHIKIDSGMGRLGLHNSEDATHFIEEALTIPHVQVEGLFTHYAKADETDKGYTVQQHERFDAVVKHFANRGIEFPYLHAGNSAAAIDSPELSYNMVRLGISMYGLYPSEEVNKQRIPLKPVLSWKTGVVMLKKLPPNSGVSYGVIYRTQDHEMIATLPVGYADGYTRRLTGRAQVLIGGRKVPVVGRICMDQCMIDVSRVPNAALHDEVVLIGEQDGEIITAEDVATQLETINYEITCMISHRVPRVYVSGGKVVKTVNPLG